MNLKLRCFTSFLLITVAGYFLSNALAKQNAYTKQRRVSAVSDVTIRTPIYNTGGFTFGSTNHLLPGSPVLGFQDVEPEIKTDIFGTIYITAIEGVPAGVDLWKSTDKGGSFAYLGQPDGAQCPAPPNCTNEAGRGGGF